MFLVAVLLGSAILMIAAIQAWGVEHYAGWLRQSTLPAPQTIDYPPAAIVLSLRGTDPFLEECLQRLAGQDYPQFEIHVIVDHPTDPAWTVVEDWIREHPGQPIQLSFLEERSEHAYLKTSAVRQSVLGLGTSVEVVVMADADTLVGKRWLKEMVTPLLASEVGVVTGNRWYDPNVTGWGSLVRYIYNGACMTPMLLMQAVWGGSLAMRREVFATQYFADRMLDTPTEEAAIQDAMRATGLRSVLQPAAIILNSEPCTLWSCFAFVRRQLIWTRLYYPSWWQVVVGAVMAYLIFSATFIAACMAAFTGASIVASVLAGVLFLELLVSQWSLERLQRSISRSVEASQEKPFPVISMWTRLRMLIALPLALVVISWAVISAAVARKVCWRGIQYQVVPPDSIRMEKYRPYAEVLADAAQGESLS
jgi:cellulose synthase/poly-beta-1,6-N-acetylglucosamine synthase-like glycosyltransferase